ncbi:MULTISPECIES: hypothetical protein [Cyanophyceae]|uniref:hypothetical protein n=1 Tax=Cyanophyceae TaxID=3028117 RepID=UPI001689FF27|nr:hypothetical protein [Trichocoleus sp. FACHB-40]MBD2006322.1 hypothetical protein [Trichocoleus sp. FACHB-40]
MKTTRWSQQDQDLLIAEYDGTKPSSELLSKKLGRSEGAIRRKAAEMNLTRCLRLRRWEPEEIQLLEEHAGSEPISTILGRLNSLCRSKGWNGRTRDSLQKQINYLGYSRRVEGDYYSLTQLSEALKCNKHVVYRWLEIPEFVKLLKPHKGEHSTLIHCKNLKKFFTVYPGELARTRPDLVWVVSVLTYTSQYKTDD